MLEQVWSDAPLYPAGANDLGGIGAMMAKALDANGAAKVYVLGRRMDKLQEVAKLAVCKGALKLLRQIMC